MVFRIIGTILMGLSCFTCFFKNISVFKDYEHVDRDVILFTLYGLLWRAFVIAALWLIK